MVKIYAFFSNQIGEKSNNELWFLLNKITIGLKTNGVNRFSEKKN